MLIGICFLSCIGFRDHAMMGSEGRGASLDMGFGDYRRGRGEGEVTEHMSVSSSKVGLVIGRGGEMMRSIKDNSGALKGILSQPLS